MLHFWFQNLCNDPSKLSNIFYKLLYNMSERGVYHAEWIKAVKSRLIKYDMYNFWEDQREMRMSNYNMFKTVCKQRIQDYYKKEWQISVNESSKCYLYKGFKSELNLESYLLKVPDSLRIPLTKFRLCNHKLPIEIGRYQNIDRQFRVCIKCLNGDIGDEYHYLFICNFFSGERKKLLPNKSYTRPSVHKFCELMSSSSNKTVLKIARFCKIIMSRFN